MYVMAQTYGVESILPLHRFASRGRTANKLRAVPVKLRIIEADAADIRRHLVSSQYLSSDLDGRTGRDAERRIRDHRESSYERVLSQLSHPTYRYRQHSPRRRLSSPTDDRGSRAQGVLECPSIWDI